MTATEASIGTEPLPRGPMWRLARDLAGVGADLLERGTPGGSVPRTTRHDVAVVMVAWDPAASRRCARELALKLAKVCPSARKVVVDNRGSGPEWAPEFGFEVAPGDNSAREFSGLESGIAYVRRFGSPAAWILANDRYLANYESLLDDLDGATIDAVVATNSLAGRVNGYPRASRSFGLEISSWACTTLLVIADDALRTLSPLVAVGEPELKAVIGPVPGRPPLLRAGGPLDSQHASYLTEWLTGEGCALDRRWYRHQPIGPDSWGDLTAKVGCILNEQLLSARARDQGIPVLPISTAHSLGRMDPSSLTSRSMVKLIRQRPVASVRWFRGTVGRVLFALQGRFEQRRRRSSAG